MKFMIALLVCALGLLAYSETKTVTRDVAFDGTKSFIFPGKCPTSGYRPLRESHAEMLGSARLEFKTPREEVFERHGLVYCAYRCQLHYEPVELDGLLVCMGGT